MLDNDLYTPLGLALREEKQRIAHKLLDQKRYTLDLNVGGGYWSSLMHIAVAKLDVKTVVKLIMRKADPDAHDVKNGDRPLHTLMNVYQKNTVAAKKILGFLVEAGANINSKNNEQWTPLHLAVKKGHLDAVESFLTYKSQGLVDLDCPGGPQDSSPLHVAA